MICARVVTIWTLAIVCTAIGWAQDAGESQDGSFFLESIAPEAGGSGLDQLLPDPNRYEVNLRLSSGLGVYHNFQRTEIARDDAVFNTGIQEAARTAATLGLGSRTALTFSRDDTQINDVLSQMMETHNVTAMELRQGFGGGASVGELSLYRGLLTDETPDQGELRTMVQRMGLQAGLGEGSQFQGGWESRESAEAGRLSETSYHGDLKMALSGGEGTAHFGYLERLVEGQQSSQRQFDLVAPFAVSGGTALAEHHLLTEIIDDSERITRKTNLVLPLDLIRTGALASYVEDTKIVDDVRNEKSTFTLGVPLSLFGRDSKFEQIMSETIRANAVTEETTLRLSAQFSGSSALIERYEAVVPVGESFQRRRRLTIESPRISLTDHLSLAAGQVRSDVLGVESSRVSHVDLTAEPFEPMDVMAQYRLYDHPDGRETADRSVQTVLALGETTTLRGSISEAEVLDNATAVMRHVELQRDAPGEGDLDMRVGYTAYGEQTENNGPAMLAQVSVGDDRHIGVSATYTEYDERKLEPLAEPTTLVQVRAGNPERLEIRAGFTEQAGRVEPERVMGLAMRAFGGALRLDYTANPLDPRGRTVMVSDLYELAFQRTIFGGVGLDMGFKYWIPDGDLDIERYYKLQLDGGNEEGGGKITLSYLSGHFVPYPQQGDPPASLLDLTYDKRWPGSGRIHVSVSRDEPPAMSVGIEDNLEAELQYQMTF